MSYYLIAVDENGNPRILGPFATEGERIVTLIQNLEELGRVFWLNLGRDTIECGKFEVLGVDL